MNVVVCPHCGARYRADYEKIPVPGKMLKCGKCGDSFGVLKNDEYYQTHFSREMCAYILHRKHAGQIANLKYDLNRLQILETYLKEHQSSLLAATPAQIQDFLKDINRRFSPRHISGLSTTLQEFYSLLVTMGLTQTNPTLKPPRSTLPATEKPRETAFKCPKCAHPMDLPPEEIPPFGVCLACPKCAAPFPAMKPDEYYTQHYSPAIAAYLLHRKRARNIANLEFDMQRLEVMESFLAKEGRSMTGVNSEEIRFFLKRLEEKQPREQVEGFRVTIADFYSVLTKLGLIAKHQAQHPALLKTTHTDEGMTAEGMTDEPPPPTFRAPLVTTSRLELHRKRRPLILGASALVAGLLGLAIYFTWQLPSQAPEPPTNSGDSLRPAIPTVPLHVAAKQGLTSELRAHLLAKADLHAVIPPFAETPLHLAAQHGQKEATRLLLQAGADPNRTNVHGSTPLHKAAASNHSAVAQILLESKAKVDAVNAAGRTPLYEAMQYGTEPILALLIGAGADVNAVSSNGNTPLHRAATEGNVTAVKMLIKAGGDLQVRNQLGETPLQSAERLKQSKVVGTLERAMRAREGSPPPASK